MDPGPSVIRRLIRPLPGGEAARDLLNLTLVGLFGLGVRIWLAGSLDLRDLPGPAGVSLLSGMYGLERFGTPLSTALGFVAVRFDLAPLMLLSGVSRLCSLLMVWGAGLMGLALGGSRAGLVSAALAAVWGPLVLSGVLLGPDVIVGGLAWFGTGLVLWSVGRGGWGIPLGALGVGLGLLACGIKVSVAPAVVLCGLAPFMIRRESWKGGLIGSVVVLGLLYLGLPLLSPGVNPMTSRPVHPGPLMAWQGLVSLPTYLRSEPVGLVQAALLVVAIGACLAPFRGWSRRVLALGLSLVCLGIVITANDGVLRLRYLNPGFLGILAVVGAGLGALGDAWVSLFKGPRAKLLAGPLWLVAPVLLVTWLGQDMVAYARGWSDLRVAYSDVDPAMLPAVDDGWRRHYSRLNRFEFYDYSEVGAQSLVSLGMNVGPGGVGTVSMRDARDAHLVAGALLGGKRVVVISPEACCPEGATRACARRVAEELSASGMLLVLPAAQHGEPGEDRQEGRMSTFLYDLRSGLQAVRATDRRGRWELLQTANRGDGHLPCGGPLGRRLGEPPWSWERIKARMNWQYGL